MVALGEPPLARLVDALRTQPAVVAAWLFGSRARGTARPESDVDLALLVREPSEPGLRPRLRLQLTCADALGLPAERVDLVLLDHAPALLTHEVLREGRRPLDLDPELRVEFEVQALHRFMEAARLRDDAMRARLRRLAPEVA
jgi:predicted nucleotidyltransferase